MKNKYRFENISIPVYFTIVDNKVIIDVQSMEEEFDFKVNELQNKK